MFNGLLNVLNKLVSYWVSHILITVFFIRLRLINGFKKKLQLIHFLIIALVNSLGLLNSMTRMLECEICDIVLDK
jgi:hypothetical protein